MKGLDVCVDNAGNFCLIMEEGSADGPWKFYNFCLWNVCYSAIFIVHNGDVWKSFSVNQIKIRYGINVTSRTWDLRSTTPSSIAGSNAMRRSWWMCWNAAGKCWSLSPGHGLRPRPALCRRAAHSTTCECVASASPHDNYVTPPSNSAGWSAPLCDRGGESSPGQSLDESLDRRSGRRRMDDCEQSTCTIHRVSRSPPQPSFRSDRGFRRRRSELNESISRASSLGNA